MSLGAPFNVFVADAPMRITKMGENLRAFVGGEERFAPFDLAMGDRVDFYATIGVEVHARTVDFDIQWWEQ